VSTALIFALGVLVTGITVAAVVLVGLAEAADPKHSRPQDLTEWERSIVGRSPSQEKPEGTDG
jgi:hypothetical protein